MDLLSSLTYAAICIVLQDIPNSVNQWSVSTADAGGIFSSPASCC